jgi:hypothetical protein
VYDINYDSLTRICTFIFVNGVSDFNDGEFLSGHCRLRGACVWTDDDVIAEDYASLGNYSNQSKCRTLVSSKYYLCSYAELLLKLSDLNEN